MSIELTKSAIKELKRFQEDQEMPETEVVRVGISGGGCSGFSYNMSFQSEEEIDKEVDNIKEFDGIRVVVDRKSMLYLDGTTIDWIEDLTHRGFNFDNPNAVKSCGCNKSFNV